MKKVYSIQKKKLPNDLMESIITGNVVLIIGHQSLLNSQNVQLSEFSGDVNQCMFQLYKENYGVIGTNFNEYCHSPQIDTTGVKHLLADMLDSNDKEFYNVDDDVNPLLYKLIKTGFFHLILTTTIDHYLEHTIRKALEGTGKNLRVLNIFASKKEDNDITELDVRLGAMQPTLYYMLGKAESFEQGKKAPFALIDDDYFEVIERWMKYVRNIGTYLTNKRILSIGCKFDDWLYRFFWYSLGCNLKNIRSGSNIAFSDSNTQSGDSSLQAFFQRVGADYIPDANAFMSHLLRKNADGELLLHQVERDYLRRTKEDDGIFISYSSADYDKVKYLEENLKQYGFKVWFDKAELAPSQEYRREILEAINKCKVFMPVFSENTFAHIKEDFHFYRDVEWAHANTIFKLRYHGKHDKISDVELPVTIPSDNNLPSLKSYRVGKMYVMPITLCTKTINFVKDEIKKDYPYIFDKQTGRYIDDFNAIIGKLNKIFKINE